MTWHIEDGVGLRALTTTGLLNAMVFRKATIKLIVVVSQTGSRGLCCFRLALS